MPFKSGHVLKAFPDGHAKPMGKSLFWAPVGASWALLGSSWALLGGSWAPLGPLLGALGRLLGSTWPSKPHSKRNLASLGSIFAALATLKIELSPARELNFIVFAVLPFKTAFGAQLASSWAPLGACRGAFESHLAVLGRPLDSNWSLLGASWNSWAPFGVLLGAQDLPGDDHGCVYGAGVTYMFLCCQRERFVSGRGF